MQIWCLLALASSLYILSLIPFPYAVIIHLEYIHQIIFQCCWLQFQARNPAIACCKVDRPSRKVRLMFLLPSSFLDYRVSLPKLKKFFKPDAWVLLSSTSMQHFFFLDSILKFMCVQPYLQLQWRRRQTCGIVLLAKKKMMEHWRSCVVNSA